MTAPRRAVLALGSNLGDRLEHLQAAVDALAACRSIDLLEVSPVYETAPVGGPEQPDYLNAVVLVDTVIDPEALLEVGLSVETARGRVRGERWGPRTLDVDVVQVHGEPRVSERLTLPHPRAYERAFVLRPWLDVDPDAELEGRGRVADLVAELRDADVRRRDDLPLRVPA